MRSLAIGVVLSSTIACGSASPAPTAPSTAPSTDPTTFLAIGTVVEIGAGPVANATVSAASCNPSPSYGNVFGQTVTDEAGGFRLLVASGSQLPIGCVFLRVKKEGYVVTEMSPHGSAEAVTVRIQRLRQVAGTVVDVDGGPVPGVKVTSSGPITFTDANGSFVQSVVGGFLTIAKDGYVSRVVEVPAGQDVTLGIVGIQPSIAVSGVSNLSRSISPADVGYQVADMWDDGVWCRPCKWIDVQTGQQDLEIHLQWSGEIPLQLWATADDYGQSLKATAKPGQSALTLRIPAATRILLVGIRSQTSAPQTLQQPEAFELTTVVR